MYGKGMSYKKDMGYVPGGTMSDDGLGEFDPRGYIMTEHNMEKMTRKRMKKYKNGYMIIRR